MQTRDPRAKTWFLVSFAYLVLVALMGTLLRLNFFYPLTGIPYDHLLHAHSHTGMLGWVYSVLFTGLLLVFHPQGFWERRYKVLFWATQVANLGMLVTFLMQGYGAYSIAFSTLHILLSYAFILVFTKDTKALLKTYSVPEAYALKFVYAGLFYLFLSSFGPWGLAVIAANGLKDSNLYDQAIYFYLHFQYNGWFLLTLIGLFVNYLGGHTSLSIQPLARAFHLLAWTMIPAYALSLLGFEVSCIILGIALVTALLQLAGGLSLGASFRFGRPDNGGQPKVIQAIGIFVIGMFFLKWIFQAIGAVPLFHELSYQTREVVIGYLHLNMLGIVTAGLFYWGYQYRLLKLNTKIAKTGLWIFLTGFILSEILLFGQGLGSWGFQVGIPGFQQWAFGMHGLMLAGLGMMGIGEMKRSNV